MASNPSETVAQLLCLERGGPFAIKSALQHTIEPDQVLIHQRVIALNGLDYKQRDYGLFISRWPHVLGVEGAGVVEAVGSNVEGLQPGDEVLAWEAGKAHGQNWGGAFQDYLVMPACYVAKKPKNISFEEAASLPICYNTAICTLYNLGLKIPIANFRNMSAHAADRAPKSILILGGSSGIGANAIQLLRMAYPSLPILTTSSPAHHARLLTLGATAVFDYHSPTVVSDIKNASPESLGVDVIFDCVSAGLTQLDICDTLDPSGLKKYGAVVTGVQQVEVPEGVSLIPSGGWPLIDMPDGKLVIPALTKFIEENNYKVPLPTKVVGHGLDQVDGVLDQLKTVSGAKLIVTL